MNSSPWQPSYCNFFLEKNQTAPTVSEYNIIYNDIHCIASFIALSSSNNDYRFNVELHLNGLNVLLISTDSLCLMTRVDSVHFTDAVLTMYEVAVDQLSDYQHINTVPCVSVVNMPSGSIVGLNQIELIKRQKVVIIN